MVSRLLNHVVLIGRLVRDPELRYTSNGTPVSNFTLAVERRFANQQGERDVDFIRIVTWRKLAETCAHHLGKGRLVAIEGSIQVRKSEKDGRTYLNTEIIANEVRFLDWPADSKGSSGSNYKNNNNNNNNNNNDNNSFDLDDDFDVPF